MVIKWRGFNQWKTEKEGKKENKERSSVTRYNTNEPLKKKSQSQKVTNCMIPLYEMSSIDKSIKNTK